MASPPRAPRSPCAIRSLWAAAPKPFDGRFYRWYAVESHPKPVQKGGVPIVVGGHVEGAARIGDGFFPAKGGLAELPGLLAAMRDACKKLGRKLEAIEITATGASLDSDTMKRYEEIGVSRLVIAPPGFDPEGLRRGLGGFAERFIARR